MPGGNPRSLGSGMVIGQHGWWNCPTLSGYKVNFVPLDNRRLAGSPRILIGGVLSDDERLTFRCPVRVVYRFYCKTRKFSWVMTRKLSETLSRNFVHSCGMVSRMNARMASANCF